MLWVAFLYAVNMRCSHLLVNKAAWAYDKVEQSQAGTQSRDTGQEGRDCRDVSSHPRNDRPADP